MLILLKSLDLELDKLPFDGKSPRPINCKAKMKWVRPCTIDLLCSEMKDPPHAFHVNRPSVLQLAI